MSDDSDETEIPGFEELNKDAEVDRNPNKPPKYSDLPACDICGQRYDFTVPEKVVEFSDERYRHFDTTKWICTKCYLDELKKSTRLSDKQAIAVAYFLQSSTNDPASAAGMTEEQMADIIESLKEEVAEARKLVDLAGDLQWTLHPEID